MPIADALYSSKSGEWETPQDLYDVLDEEFNFNLDPAATDENHKCDYYITEKNDGLSIPWELPGCAKGKVFLNPPYGRIIGRWIQKAVSEYVQGNAELVVMLLPVRTDTVWFHKWIYNQPWVTDIRFIKGRLKFGGATNSAPFPSMIVVIGGDR